MKERELLKPKYDIVFQALFQNNTDNITENFITEILGEKVKIVDIKTDNTIIKKYPTEKGGRLDLIAKLEDGSLCQIEMQMTDKGDTIKRILYYWARTYSGQLKRGEEYKNLKKTIGIIITDYEILNGEKYELEHYNPDDEKINKALLVEYLYTDEMDGRP